MIDDEEGGSTTSQALGSVAKYAVLLASGVFFCKTVVSVVMKIITFRKWNAKRKDKKTKKEMMNLKGYAEVDGDTEGVVEMKEKERVWLEESDLVPSPKSVPRPRIKKEFDVFDDIMSTMPSTMTEHYYDGDAPVAAPVRSPTHRASATFAKAPMRPPVRQLPDFDEY